MAFSSIPEILDELRTGRVIVLVDDERRENEGDFVCAAEKITPEIINFMTRIGGGYMCVSLTGADCDRLGLVPQVPHNNSLHGTPLTVTVDGNPRHGVGTGVSAPDRTKTIKLLIDSATTAADFVRPGHINPLRSRDGGVLVRTGQTEGSIDLTRIAGLHPSAVIIEIVHEDGEMARMPELIEVCRKHDLKMCSVEQIIQHRLAEECLMERLAPADGTPIDTPYGCFDLFAFQSAIDPLPHLALTVGGIGRTDHYGSSPPFEEPVLVRVHRRDLLGDVFDEASNPSGQSLRAAMKQIQAAGCGVLVYVRPEGSGDDVRERIQRVSRPETPDVNVPDFTRASQPAPFHEIGTGGQILRDLGLRKLRVLTNHPRTYSGLAGFGLEVVEQVPIETPKRRNAETPK